MIPEIRTVVESELPAFVDAMSSAFLERPDIARAADEVRPLWDLDRAWAAFDAGRICATFRSFATELTVPGGGRLPAAAVSGVTVLPTHRRRGILRRLVAAEHGAIRERGEAVGVLHASEYPIYGRFGYGPSAPLATWTLDALATGFHTPAEGSMELLNPSPAVAAAMRDVYEAWRPRQPGEIRRRDLRWESDLGLRETAWGTRWNGFVAVHRDATGNVDGYVRYRPEAERWEQRQPRNALVVDDLHALTDGAYLALWSYLAGIDWVAGVKAEFRSPAERLPWLLTNARAAVASDIGDGLWLRLLDIPRALAARSYAQEARLVLEVIDPEAAGGKTRVELDAAGPDGATARTTDRPPDLTLDVSALGAAYLGGVRLRDAVLASGVDEHRSGALDEADRLLRTPEPPWCSTFF